MKKIIYLLIILFAPYSHGQSDENKRHEAYFAKIIDENFFQQLDFIVDNYSQFLQNRRYCREKFGG